MSSLSITTAGAANKTVDESKDENCKSASDLHCWTFENIRRDCSIFSGIKVKLAAVGANHTVIVTKNFNVFAVGSNEYGQLGLGDRTDRKSLREIGCLIEKRVIDIACGDRHSAAITYKGQLFCWGDSRQGQCGQGETGIFTTPCRVQFPVRKQVGQCKKGVKVQKIACGNMHTFTVDNDGCLWCCGTGIATGFGNDTYKALVPEKVTKMQNKFIKDISCGKFHSIALVHKEQNMKNDDSNVLLSVESSSLSDTDQNEFIRTESNVAQKIPFLENIFYIEEEDRPVNLSEMQKFSKSDTQIFSSSKNLDTSDVDKINKSLESKNRSTNTNNGYTFENKMFYEDDSKKLKHKVNELKKSNSFPSSSLVADEDVLKSKSTDTSILIYQPGQRMQASKDVKNDGCDRKLNYSDNDFYYSALDFAVENKKFAAFEVKCNQMPLCVSIDEVDVKFRAKKDPLCPSLDEEMENMIQTPSCSVIHDETFATSETLDKNMKESSWSIAAKTSFFDEERIRSSSSITESYEVWVWGSNDSGQLGINNSSHDSLEPICLDSLKCKDIVRISAGGKHSLALTKSSLVLSWGDNSFGQLGLSKSASYSPQVVQLFDNARVWDIAAGGEFSLFLADSKNNSHMYHLGKVARTVENDLSSSLHISERTGKRNKSFKLRKMKSKTESLAASDRAEWYVETELREVEHFSKKDILRRVIASSHQFACITESDAKESFRIIYSLASSERRYHCQLRSIQTHIMDPLQNTDAWYSMTKLPGGEALFAVVECFTDLLQSIMIGLSQLTEVISSHLEVKDMFSFFFSDSFRAMYDRYAKCYCDTLAVGHLHSLSKTVSNVIAKLDSSVKAAFHDLVWDQSSLAELLKIPLKRSSYYCKCIEKLVKCLKATVDPDEQEINHLQQVVHRWQEFADHTSRLLREADETREFWEKSPAKLIEALKDPHRRIVKTSRNSPLSLARPSRLSSHFFMLFNDVFVHSQSNRHFQVFPLVTMWSEPLAETEQMKFALKITAPEASMVLVADSNLGRIDWLRELNAAIAHCLSATSSHRVTVESVNSISGVLRAADAREASYTYINHQKYKAARYNGMWLSGVPHGRGRIDWPNGETYEGEFLNGSFHGYGIMFFSEEANEERYEGDWSDGKMNGFGKMRYHNGDEYVGNWVDDIRAGHGTFKCFSFDRGLVTIYIGDWLNDQKNGYGVQDFVVRGEKYIGMWMNNQRHGYGIVVTVDGVYYEGRFLQNRLAGKGILLSDDDTCYEGEFTADMQLNGKGILTLPNGDFIEGHFHGNWGEGIRINGIFNKFANPDPSMSQIGDIASSQLSLTDFTIPAGIKWKSLFQACFQELGLGDESSTVDMWKNIEKSIVKTRMSDVRRQVIRRQDFNKKLGNIIKTEKSMHIKDLGDIEVYITEAIDTFGHPLNNLVEALIEVYRATYVGVGAHRRLLLHAVEEAKSYISRLFHLIRLLFPSLPDEDFVVLSNNRAIGEDDHLFTSTTLLHPLILPRLYPPLFTLYALHTEKADAMYTERLYQLNKRGNIALMSFLGVNKDFLLSNFDEETKLPNTAEKPPYESAIDELETITTKYSPMEKIEVIRRSFLKIHQEVDEFWKAKKKLMAMDDLFPVFQYVVIRAKIPHLGSEIQFIEDLIERSVLVGELGHMITTLKACYFQIQKEQERD